METIKNSNVTEMKNFMQRNITDVTPSVVYNANEKKEVRLHRPKNVNPEISGMHIFEGVMDVVMHILKPRS